MIVAVCVDDRNGMLFHRRRQSQDRALREDILSRCSGPLHMDGYSAKLFADHADRICVDEEFLSGAQAGEWCFVEDRPLTPWAEKIEKLVVYRWNRAYPADVHLDLKLELFALEDRQDFPGTSHDAITREIYHRV